MITPSLVQIVKRSIAPVTSEYLTWRSKLMPSVIQWLLIQKAAVAAHRSSESSVSAFRRYRPIRLMPSLPPELFHTPDIAPASPANHIRISGRGRTGGGG